MEPTIPSSFVKREYSTFLIALAVILLVALAYFFYFSEKDEPIPEGVSDYEKKGLQALRDLREKSKLAPTVSQNRDTLSKLGDLVKPESEPEPELSGAGKLQVLRALKEKSNQ